MSSVYKINTKNLFIDTPEVLFAAAKFKWTSVCYRFAGVNNPVINSRYPWAKWFGNLFEKRMFNHLSNFEKCVLLASADQMSINEMVRRSSGKLKRCYIHQFPTRVDTDKFRPMSKIAARKAINIDKNKVIIVACGRLSWIKGWDLILGAVNVLRQREVDLQMIFVGDGEDRSKIRRKSDELGISGLIKITGFIPHAEVKQYLNAADVCVVASHREGWSLAMLEILACGKPLVATNVSGAYDMIYNGRNGFIVENRDPVNFADTILKTIDLIDFEQISTQIAERFSTKKIEDDLSKIWAPLSIH
jgi:glycosyltransferase involved in cell wall biosynthesis